MEQFLGREWANLSQEEQLQVTGLANPMDIRTGERPTGAGLCIVNLRGTPVCVEGYYTPRETGFRLSIGPKNIFYNFRVCANAIESQLRPYEESQIRPDRGDILWGRR